MTTTRHKHESCPLCGSTQWRKLIKDGDLPDAGAMLQCKDCDLAFFSEVRSDDAYWGREEHFEVYQEADDDLVADFQRHLPLLNDACQAKGRLLDVGCGTGSFMKLAQAEGWQVEGIEPGAAAVKMVKETLNMPVHEGFFESVDLEENAYDCVTMWDVIEHLYDPGQALEKVSRILKPGGIFVFITPNERSLFKRLPLFAYKASFGLLKAFLKYVYYDPHFYSYSPVCCKTMLSTRGMDISVMNFESTAKTFRTKKLDHSYSKYTVSLAIVKFVLPMGIWLSKLCGRQNKLFVIARKR